MATYNCDYDLKLIGDYGYDNYFTKTYTIMVNHRRSYKICCDSDGVVESINYVINNYPEEQSSERFTHLYWRTEDTGEEYFIPFKDHNNFIDLDIEEQLEEANKEVEKYYKIEEKDYDPEEHNFRLFAEVGEVYQWD